MARIGLWGGSFNPPTIAHKALADFAFDALSLDALWWIVSPHNPLKDIKTLAPFQHRLAMVTQFLADRPHMLPNDLESGLGTSFTINTVRHIRQSHSDDTLFWFMGMDNWQNFHLWGDEHAHIFDYVSIVVLQRPGYGDVKDHLSSEEFKDRFVSDPQSLKPFGTWTVLENPIMDIASTYVRAAIAKGEKHAHITDEIWDYIQQNNLYSAK